jgi:two-component system nitrate/nitrite response regulator NarP
MLAEPRAARLLIADDHPIVLDGLKALFHGTEFECIAECRTGAEVLQQLSARMPDLMILDIQMPVMNGLEVVRHLASRSVSIPIVLLTASLTDHEALDAMELGIGGLVLKESAPRQLLQCAQAVCAGEKWIDPEATHRILHQALTVGKSSKPISVLTTREQRLAELVARGLRNKEIAMQLEITEGTVKMHLHHIYEKLSIGSRTELAMYIRDRSGL